MVARGSADDFGWHRFWRGLGRLGEMKVSVIFVCCSALLNNKNSFSESYRGAVVLGVDVESANKPLSFLGILL